MDSSKRESIANTFFVAIVVCLVCSTIVSTAHYLLEPLQKANKALDIKKNIVAAIGLDENQIEAAGGINGLFEGDSPRISTQIIDLRTGEESLEKVQEIYQHESPEQTLAEYDQFTAAKDTERGDELNVRLEGSADLAKIKSREHYSPVYIFKDEQGNPDKYVFPIRGLGLWSTLKGFIALESDFQTVVGLTYYEHGETPGLGGEVDNSKWKANWIGKKVFGDDGLVALRVVKGVAADEFGVDGLSGATITSNGVTNMLEFWLGESGFGPYIAKVKAANGTSTGGSNEGEGGSGG